MPCGARHAVRSGKCRATTVVCRAECCPMELPAEELRNGDIRLRRWRRGDVDAVLRAVAESLDHLRPFMLFVSNGYDRQSAVKFLEDSDAQWADRTAFGYAILSSGGEVIG